MSADPNAPSAAPSALHPVDPAAVPSTVDPIPNVLDVLTFKGRDSDGVPDLLIEVPHGATTTADFESVAALLTSPLPASLIDFFYVNTDTGAPELAQALAERIIAASPERTVLVLRCRIPRTFIDCNRVLDASAADYKAGGVAPGLMPWITSPEDVALLRGRYESYVAAVRQAAAALPAHGAMLLLHSYAPRTVGVEVDANIVASLHAAYAPDVAATWPARPEMDVIGRGADGTLHAPAAVVDALRAELAADGMTLGDSHTYRLHPSTLGWEHAMRLPGRSLCLEIRRDLFVEHFEPFVEARIDPTRTAQLAGPVTRALMQLW